MGKRSVSSLVYLNEDILYLRNKRIEEYDIVEGGWSVARNEGLLPRKFVRYLSGLDKKRRHIEIGMYSRDNKEFTKDLFEGFRHYVSMFREENGIDDEKVLSIKKDSITLYDSPISQRKFGDHVEFTLRETATSYLLLGKKEFFLNSKNGKFWFKGFDSEIQIENTLLEEIKKLMEFGEYKDKKFMFEYLKEIRQSYVERELSHTYYRELNAINGYKINDRIAGCNVYLENSCDDDIDSLDISYNYEEVIVPLIRILV